jgi:aryl-alcohol dehydrogenase-like predicted oxidoreductase
VDAQSGPLCVSCFAGRHSERVLGRALAGHRDEVVIAAKFGNTFDAGRRAGRDTRHPTRLTPFAVLVFCVAAGKMGGMVFELTDRIERHLAVMAA